MLHGSKRCRQGSALLTVIVLALGLVGALAPAAGASYLSRPGRPVAAPAATAQTVRLVQLPGGGLEVVTGPAFARSAGTVLVEEVDVPLHTTLVDVRSLLGPEGLANDLLRDDQWGLDAVQAELAWEIADGSGQVIAIIDSGVDGNHPDLQGRLVDGFSATDGDELVDEHGHGTHVAGTAAATAGDGFGVAGLAHAASIMPVQVTDETGSAFASDVAEGLIWAVDHGATIANLSLAGTQRSLVLDGAISYAVEHGVVVVVAGGNEYQRDNPRTYPASNEQVLAVAAMSDTTSRASFSSTGDFIDLAAPGASILSDRPGGAFGFASGTSMAAPLVAGAIALIRSTTDVLDPAGLADLLTQTAVDVGAPGRDDEFGAGALDVLAALEEVRPTGSDADDDVPVEDVPEVPELPAVDPITQALGDGSWVSEGWGLG